MKLTKKPPRPSIWDDPRTKALQHLAYEGFTQKACCQFLKLSVGRVQYRCRRLGVSAQKERQGLTDRAKEKAIRIILRYSPVARFLGRKAS